LRTQNRRVCRTPPRQHRPPRPRCLHSRRKRWLLPCTAPSHQCTSGSHGARGVIQKPMEGPLLTKGLARCLSKRIEA
jgi:hypothetical protein